MHARLQHALVRAVDEEQADLTVIDDEGRYQFRPTGARQPAHQLRIDVEPFGQIDARLGPRTGRVPDHELLVRREHRVELAVALDDRHFAAVRPEDRQFAGCHPGSLSNKGFS